MAWHSRYVEAIDELLGCIADAPDPKAKGTLEELAGAFCMYSRGPHEECLAGSPFSLIRRWRYQAETACAPLSRPNKKCEVEKAEATKTARDAADAEAEAARALLLEQLDSAVKTAARDAR